MENARIGHTASVLPSGAVLVVGGYAPGPGTLSGAELWEPGTRRFRAIAPLTIARQLHAASLTKDGRVIVIGGAREIECPPKEHRPRCYEQLAGTEIWDPNLDRWLEGPPLNAARSGASALQLADGRLFVVGGEPRTAELLDPKSGAFSVEAGPAVARGPALSLFDGSVLVIGESSAERWDPAARRWNEAGRHEARRAFTATLLEDGRVLISGGTIKDKKRWVPAPNGELWDPASGSFSDAGPLATPRADHAAVRLLDGRVALAGGAGRRFVPNVEVYQPKLARFRTVATLFPPRSLAVAVVLGDGRLMLIGGESSAGILDDVQILRLSAGTPAGEEPR
jgi:hypothetical protein